MIRTHLAAAMNVDVSTTVQAQTGVVTEGMKVHKDNVITGEKVTADNNDDTIVENNNNTKSGHTHFKS